jgi:hypothetical protein
MSESGTPLEQAERRLDKADAALDAVRRVLEAAEKVQAAAESRSPALRTADIVAVGSVLIVAVAVLVSHRRH